LSPKPADPAAVQALRDLVAAKGRAQEVTRLRFEAGHANALDHALAKIELIEARVRLAEAEGDRAAVVPLREDLVARREEERQFIATLVEVGRAPPDDLDRAVARVADAKARLASARSAAAAVVTVPSAAVEKK
jgi:outer membrane protein TolC